MVAFEAEEKKVGFWGMLKLLFLKPRSFFKQTVAIDKYPNLAFSAWLIGLAHSFMWMDKMLLSQGGMIANQFASFVLTILMSFVFMGVFYLAGGVLFHFYAYLADSRKDMKNSLAIVAYAWMPFVVTVLLVKVISIILLRNDYLNPPEGWWFQMPSMALVGLSVLYGWFLAIYGAVVGLGCKKFRGFIMLFVVPILWFVLLYTIYNSMM